MVYIEVEKQPNSNIGRVIFIHNFPDMLTEEEKSKGLLVEQIPVAEQNGKAAQLFINTDTREMHYEYYDMPKTQEQNIEARVAALEVAMANTLGM